MTRGYLLAALLLASSATPLAADPLPELFTRVNPSVVVVLVSQSDVPAAGASQPVRTSSLGSGTLISAEGLVLTAAHVVQTADQVAVRFLAGEVVAARVVASDPQADVALLRVEQVPAGVPAAVLGDSDAARVGEPVFIIGAPLGVTHTLTAGLISARRQVNDLFGGFRPVELLQTDAAINQGNSGGPMFNMNGEVIGVVSHIISTTGGFQGLGFVVTSNLARELLLDDPTMWTGLNGYLLEGELARVLNLPQESGILVQQVAAGSPAATLGLRPGTVRATVAGQPLILGGDVILRVLGIEVGGEDSAAAIRTAMKALPASELLEVTVLRDGREVTLRKAQYLFSR